MTDKNLEAWAMLQGYEPTHNYQPLHPVTPSDPNQLSPHFRQQEFKCKCCGKIHPTNPTPPEVVLFWLESAREHFGDRPVMITSGYRCPKHNAAVGGASTSRHMEGDAVDFHVEGISPAEVYIYMDSIVGEGGGVGMYDSFTHIDSRGYKARW